MLLQMSGMHFQCYVESGGLSDPRVVHTLQICPDVDLGSLGFYAGLFLAILFVLFCAVAYLIFNVLRLFVHQEMLLFLVTG